MMGWIPPWEYKRDCASFKFAVTHTGRNYYIDANLENGNLTIAETPKGILQVLHGLHFFNGKVPKCPLHPSHLDCVSMANPFCNAHFFNPRTMALALD